MEVWILLVFALYSPFAFLAWALRDVMASRGDRRAASREAREVDSDDTAASGRSAST